MGAIRQERNARLEAGRYGVPVHSRRLGDKVLAAFTHAYAIGEYDIARRLRAVLAAVDGKEGLEYPERRASDALQQASLWVAYVEARNAYNGATAAGQAGDRSVLAAAEAMTEAFKRWSFS
jgi:hypothetical protein